MVEQSAVNRWVAGSSPASGANSPRREFLFAGDASDFNSIFSRFPLGGVVSLSNKKSGDALPGIATVLNFCNAVEIGVIRNEEYKSAAPSLAHRKTEG